MKKNKVVVLFICPIKSSFETGAANAVKMTYLELKKENNINFLNTAEGVTNSNIRKFTFLRFFYLIKLIINFFLKIFFTNKVYIVVSLSMFGFLRDAFFIILSKIFFKKVILHLHGAGFRENFFTKQKNIIKKVIVFTYSISDRLIILSQKLKKDFYFLKQDKIFVLPNYIDYNCSNIKTKIENRNFNSIQIIYLSNMIYSKGYMTLIEACRVLKDKKIDFKCKFIGKFINDYKIDSIDQINYKDLFKKKIVEYDLNEFVNLNECFDPNLKYEVLLSSNLFILPTFYKGEGMPLSILEAMSCGLPIISTNQGAISDIVIDKYNGYLLNIKDDHNELANKILNLQTNPKLFKTMSLNSYDLFSKKFAIKNIRNKINDAFDI